MSEPTPTSSVDPARCPQCGAALPEGSPQGLCPACLLKQGFATRTGPTGGSSGQPTFVPPTREELAAHFPQLEILELIGQGGMGAVYKVRQPALDRLAALKILPPQTAARDPGFTERFNREARALARLSHPRIVHVHDFGQAGGYYYFLMEFVDGANLRQLERAGKLSPSEALAIVPQICEALQYAHDQGIVHRDIKPENILVSKQGQIKIADFGVAKLINAEQSSITLTNAGQMMGTPLYMAPEQVEHPSDVDHRADIYSLGVVFYEMLTGELPLGRFAAPSHKVQIDVRLDEVVFRALEKEPDLRYQQAGHVKTEVDNIQATPRPMTPPTAATPGGVGVGAMENPGGYNGPSRFSRKAIVGAAWAACAFIAFLMLVTVRTVQMGEYHGPSWWQYALRFTILPLGLTAPFGTMILGWVAVAQIRRSAGRIHGMWLAVIDGLFFPLIALDAGITFLIFNFGVAFLHWSRFYNDENNSKLIFLSGVAWVIVDALIFWLVWRAVNKPLVGSAPSATPPGGAFSPPPPQTPAKAARKPRGPLFGAAIVLSFILVPVAAFWVKNTWRGWRMHRVAMARTAALSVPEARSVPRPPYIARLPYGATAELWCVGDHFPAEGAPPVNRRWWQPNGTPFANSFVTKGSHSYPAKNQMAREFILKISNLPPGADPWPVWKLDPPVSWAGGEVVEADTGKTIAEMKMISATFVKAARQVTVKAGFGLGPWDTVTQQAPGSGAEVQGFSRDGQQWTVSFLRATEADGATKITAVHNVKERQVRVIAVDTAGIEHASGRTEGMGTDAFTSHTVTFDNLPLAQIKEFRFQVRPYTWVEFRNVSVNPGQRTEVEIVDAADPDAAPRTAFAAQLPHGAAVEIAGISYHPSNGQPWWNPDGSGLEGKDWQAQSGTPLYSNGNPQDRSNFRQIVLHAYGPGEKPTICSFAFSPSAKDSNFGSDGGFGVSRRGERLPQEQWQGLFEQFKPGQNAATVRVLVAAGEYTPLPDMNATRFNDHAMAARFRGKRVVLGQLFEREGQAAISFTLEMWDDLQHRLRAKDQNGQWHEGRLAEGQSSSGLLQEVRVFDGLSVRDVAQVVIETRPTYWAEFRNVSLNPGQKTEVTVIGAEQAPPDKYGPLSSFQSIAPYPETTLTLAWDGSKQKFPDPLPYLTALRTTDEYHEWQGRKDDRYFRDENAAGYHFEAHVTGMGEKQMNGGMDEIIPTVKIFRPHGGLVAAAQLGRLYANNWDVDIYDETGQKVVTRLRWLRDQQTGVTFICRVVFNPDTPQERQWWANQYGVVYSDGAEHQLPEYETKPYPLPFPPGATAWTTTTGNAARKLADARIALAELRRHFRDNHPMVVAADEQLKALTRFADANSPDYLDELKTKLTEAEAEQAELAAKHGEDHPALLDARAKTTMIRNLAGSSPADFALPAPAPAEPAPTPDAQRESLKLQLQQAEAESARAESGGKAGAVSNEDMQAAKDKVELLRATLDDNPVHVAEIKLAAAERRAEAGEKLAKTGAMSQADLEKARNERDQARLELQQAQARAATPTPFVFPTLSPEQRSALLVEANRAVNAFLNLDRAEREGDNIPPRFWGPTITALKPRQVLNERVNVKIVLSNADQAEAGFYVSIPISSYGPQRADFAEFEELKAEGNTFGKLYRYRAKAEKTAH